MIPSTYLEANNHLVVVVVVRVGVTTASSVIYRHCTHTVHRQSRKNSHIHNIKKEWEGGTVRRTEVVLSDCNMAVVWNRRDR